MLDNIYAFIYNFFEMHFKKRSSLRITSNFDHLLERVFIMPITRNDIIDCRNKLTGYGEKLKENLVTDRTKCKETIKTKYKQP